MGRLTFTIDDRSAEDLEGVRRHATELRDSLVALSERLAPEDRGDLLPALTESLARLEADASVAGVVREAVGFFLAAIMEAETAARLDAGYSVLAEDVERQEMIASLGVRAPGRWEDER